MYNSIKEIRKTKNITLREMGQWIGISESGICKMEKDPKRYKDEYLYIFAEKLKINVRNLMDIRRELICTETIEAKKKH